MTDIVFVQFKNRYGDGYGGREYSYIADVALQEGDIVKVPTVSGDTEARVSRIDVPESELPKWLGRDKLRHITEHATPPNDMFAEFFNS